MNKRQLALSIVIGVAPILALMVSMSSANGPEPGETSLNPFGEPFEINRDASGHLWVSDNRADEIWQLNPTTGVYTVYEGAANVTDARRDPSGDVWWTDFTGNRLGRISLSTNSLTLWSLGAAGNPRGTAVDDAGRVWATDSFAPHVYGFNPGTTELCTYTVPDNGASVYMVARAGEIWLGDWRQDRILKLDPTSNRFTIWQLAAGAYPGGLAADGSDNLWWVDRNQGIVAQLEPASSRLTTYPLPAGSSPRMISVSGGRVWYSEVTSRTIGMLDPAVATGTSSPLVTTTAPVTPSCNSLGSGMTTALITRTGNIVWTAAEYPTLVDGGGWTVYQLPQYASPWGVAGGDDWVSVVDRGRRKLLRLPSQVTYQLFLPVVLR